MNEQFVSFIFIKKKSCQPSNLFGIWHQMFFPFDRLVTKSQLTKYEMSVDVFCCQVRLSSFLFKLKHQQNPLDIKDIGIQVDPYLQFIILTLIHGENALIGGNFKIFGRAVFEVIEVKFRYFELKFFRQKRTALNLKIEQTIKFKPLITKDFRATLGLSKSWKVFTQHCYFQTFI